MPDDYNVGMIPLLAPVLSGPDAAHAGALHLAPGPRGAIGASTFFTSAALTAFFDEQQASRQIADRRAFVSIWSKRYVASFLLPTLAASLLLQRRLPVALKDVGVVLAEDGRPLGLVLADEGQPHDPAEPPFVRLATLIDHHLTPVVDALAQVSGASPRLFWSNAGNVFEFATTRIAQHRLAVADCTAPAEAILQARERPDGARNPLFRPVIYRDDVMDEEGNPQRVRRVCCIRYRVPGVGYCSSCPIEPGRRHHAG
ncbi:siderophore-iron reductase FhuF [Verticiella alkaliphila]|uniref:siderophore-iron reductase FhuF n=1 Tax=Verticiella alkaliphila TaxID=2779529 RepID=UPI001C0DA461|nr:siderophore-iron reductase FhuF [Verticiella sp. GG226]